MTKRDFYSSICEKYKDKEITQLILNNPSCEFYELCQAFLDVALNAETFKDKDDVLKRLFTHVDIDNAKEKSREFCIRYCIKKIDELFDIVESEFADSIDPDDNRRTNAMIKEADQSNSTYGYWGTLYFFNEISNDVYEKIVSEIKQSLQMA